jgi:hypothetical protein
MKSRVLGGTCRLLLQSLRIGKARNQHEAGSDFQQITRRYIPEDGAPHDYPCENSKSYILMIFLFSSSRLMRSLS